MELRATFFRLFLGACLLLCLTALPTLAQVIRYVKPVATGTGTGIHGPMPAVIYKP